MVNGQEVADNPTNRPPNNNSQPPQWWSVDIFNNMIVDNVAGLAGGGISLQDAVKVKIQNNTIANNDSLANRRRGVRAGKPQPVDAAARCGDRDQGQQRRPAWRSRLPDRASHNVEHSRTRARSPRTSSGRTGSSSSGWTWMPPPAASRVTRAAPRPTACARTSPGSSQLPRRQRRGLQPGPRRHRDGRKSRWNQQPADACRVDGSVGPERSLRGRVLQRRQIGRLPARGHHRHPDAGGLRRGRQLHPSQLRTAVALPGRRAQRRRPGHLFGDYHILSPSLAADQVAFRWA